jgi:hypothetical protein
MPRAARVVVPAMLYHVITRGNNREREMKMKTAAIFLLGCLLLFLLPSSSAAVDSICAQVKIEILQEMTLERQGFDAHMRINNGLTNIALTDVAVDVKFTDKDGNPVLASSDPYNTSALFFIRVDSMENIGNVDGTGRVSPSSSADIHWLIIPAPGASKGVSQGTLYYVGAKLTYKIGGEEHVTDVTPDYIFVKPMPELTLDYFLPVDVYGDDAFTPNIEPPVPFSLGVRVKNNGTGVAKKLKIDSAQPKIVENEQGLLIGFNIESTEVNGKVIPNSLLADFGDIQPNASGVARWIMTCSLSGRFVEFTAEFSHSNELGGELTSLIESVKTHFLVHDVLVDLPGRDGIRDFLATDGLGYRVYESESPESEVMDQSASSSLVFKSQTGSEMTYTLSAPVTAGFMYVQLSDPHGGNKVLREVVRSDGKRIKTENIWISKIRREDHSWQYFINLFDVNTKNSYTVIFGDPAGTPHPPALQFIADRTGVEGQQLSFIVEASDPDGTIPLLSASPLPALAKFTDQRTGTGIFDWTPAKGQAGRYETTFTASDGTLTSSQHVVLTITSKNNPPFVPSSPSPPDRGVNVSVKARLGWVGGDPDSDDIASYDVYLGTSNPPLAKVSINQFGTSYVTVDLAYNTTHYWKIVARDRQGAETAGPVWSFTTSVNYPPVAKAGPDQDVITDELVTLNGTESNDPEGTPITFRWKFVTVPPGSAVTDASLSNATSSKPTFTPDADGTYKLQLVVNDGVQDSVPDEVVIIATTPNVPPIANAGPDQNAITGSLVILNGKGSFDPEGEMITFLWAFVKVPAGSSVTDASLSDITSAKPEFTPDVNGTYRLQLVVNDGALDSDPDEVVINAATPNVAPNASAGPDQSAFTGTQVNLDGTKSSDPDNGPLPLSYLWSFVTKPLNSWLTDDNILGRNQANASFIPDVSGTYIVRLEVGDGDLTAYDDVVIIATIPNVPPNANAGADFTIPLGQTAVLDGSGSNDPDSGPQPLSYSWSFVTVPTGSKIGNGNIIEVNTSTPSFTPDMVGTYVLQLMVFDGKDAGFDNVAVTVINYHISGGAYFYPETPTYRASFSLDVTGPSSPSGWLKYYYTRTRMNFVSTGITSVSVSGNMATISGNGTVNGVGGYTFTATVTNGTPDSFAIVIKKQDGATYYSAGPKNISGGDLVIQ